MSATRRVGIALLCLIALMAVVGPELMSAAPDQQDLMRAGEGPSLDYLLGTDHVGRSTAARLAYGSRTSLLIAAGAVGIATIFGALLGIVAAAIPPVATSLRWLLDVLQALPSFIGIMLVSGLFTPSSWSIGLAVALIVWVEPCRVALFTAEAAAQEPAVEAARLVALPRATVIRRLILPPVVRPLVAVSGMMFGHAILSIAALGFLGLGLRPPTAEWGVMIADALPYIGEAPHLVLVPSIAIVLTVTGLLLALDSESVAS